MNDELSRLDKKLASRGKSGKKNKPFAKTVSSKQPPAPAPSAVKPNVPPAKKEVKKGLPTTPSTAEVNTESIKTGVPLNKAKQKRRRPNHLNKGNQKPLSGPKNDSSPS